MEPGQVAIIGSGLIGRSWAMVFAAGGFKVKLYDVAQQQLTSALENIRKIRTSAFRVFQFGKVKHKVLCVRGKSAI